MRGLKTGIDYFPLDIDYFTDPKIEFIFAKFGLAGEAISLRLLTRIYREGYFIDWKEDDCLLYASKSGINVDILTQIVDELCHRGFFNKHLYEKYSILTSNGIQKRYLEITKRRKGIFMRKEYIIADINGYDVNIISQNDSDGTQSKVKESKVKESKVDNTNNKKSYSELKNVLLTDQEFEKLMDKFGESGFNDRVEKLSLYLASKGKRYKSHYATILNWDRMDKDGTHKQNTTKGNEGKRDYTGGEYGKHVRT